MNIPKSVEVFEYIDDELLAEAIAFERKPLHSRVPQHPLFKLCACFLIVCTVFFSIYAYSHRQTTACPVVLTAYAKTDTQVSAQIMQQNMKIPVSKFEAENGISFFVFSHDRNDGKRQNSEFVHSQGMELDKEILWEILDMIGGEGKEYLIYIPEDANAPVVEITMLPFKDESGLYTFDIIITQHNGNCYAELCNIKKVEFEITTMP